MGNVYFELTEEFNRKGRISVSSSGQRTVGSTPMELLSEDDMNLKGMTRAELDAAWDLWFELAQHTNDSDPDYTHGVFVGVDLKAIGARRVPRD